MNIPSERAQEIFCNALDLESEAERAAYVNEACAGDDELQATVLRLLAVQADSARLFDTINPTSFSIVDVAQTVLQEAVLPKNDADTGFEDREVGKQIGPYRLIRKIGEGGGGNVYLAEQEKPVRRKVALKIIKLGMDTKSVISRFEAERQALALMEHPNIAHVLDAGETDAGRPFFVMELVPGTPITAYCEQQRLGIRQRMELFIQVCHAIQHAHQKGIIHRDIKPSNILIAQVDGAAVPKVIDFGIAKATGEQLLGDNTRYTACEQFVGTPAYMSPEQADLAEYDIDVRSDIYSLGVLLYELLAGKTPFDQKKLIRSGLDEMRRTIRGKEPSRPSVKLAGLPEKELELLSENRGLSSSRLIVLLRGDLDWIVMKALEKERERRYQSADGFADDVLRYLAHEPVIARPPSRRYRLCKLVRRNKVVFAASAIVILVLAASSAISTWLLIEQRIAQRRAELAEQEKGTIQKEAESLRISVESQQKVARAQVLFRRGEIESAAAILDGIQHVQASPGNASMFREIGDWHALNERWEQARMLFDVLLDINEFEGSESTMDDSRSAAILAEQGYFEAYERFRESLINRYAGTDNATTAQRVIRESMLVPANHELMRAVEQFARVVERSYREDHGVDESLKRWQAYSMALLCYRKGDWAASVDWCEKANLQDTYFPTRALSVQLIRSAALWRLGKEDEAREQFESTQAGLNQFFSSKKLGSKVWEGFWFDRSFLRIHFCEAESCLNSASEVLD